MLFSIMEAWILSQSLAVLALLGEFMLAGEVSRDLGRLVGTLQNVEPKIWFLSLLGDPEVNSSKAREFLAIVVPMGSRFVEGATRNLMGVSSCLAGQNEIAYERLGEAIEILSTNTDDLAKSRHKTVFVIPTPPQ